MAPASIIEGRALIAELQQEISSFGNDVKHADPDELRVWCEAVPAKISAIEEKVRVLKEKAQLDREAAERFVKTKDAIGPLVNSLKEDQQLAQSHVEQGKAVKDTLIRVSLRKIRNLCGTDDNFVAIIKSELQIDLGQRQNPPPIQTIPSNEPHIDIITACKKALPGASKITLWNTAAICALLHSTKRYITELRDSTGESQDVALSQSTSRQPDKALPAPSSQVYDDLYQASPKSRLMAPPEIRYRPQVMIESRPQELCQSSSPDDSWSNSIECEEDVGMLKGRLASIESFHEQQSLALQISEDTSKKLYIENTTLKRSLIRNHVFGSQLDITTVEGYAAELRKRITSLSPNPPFLRSVTAVTLADDFDNLGTTPPLQYSIRYIQTLNQELCVTQEPSNVARASLMMQMLVEEHISWLGTTIRDFTTKAGSEDTALLICFLNQIIESDNSIVSSIPRASLFMLVANLAQRSQEVRLGSIWLSLYEAIIQGRFGQPYNEWNLLDRICFAWFMSVGNSIGFGGMNLSPAHRHSFQDLIEELRLSPPSNFIRLLSLTCVRTFASNEVGLKQHSGIHHACNSLGEMVVIMRTTCGRASKLVTEYIWTYHNQRVWFSSRGFNFSLQKVDGLLVPSFQPINKILAPWFPIRTALMESYFDEFYPPHILAELDGLQMTAN